MPQLPEKITEDAYAEQPALEWLREVGWGYRHGSDLIAAPDGAERTRDSDVVLRGTLRQAVARLNPELPADAVTRAVELALTSTSPTLVLDHQSVHEMLLAGVQVSWIDDTDGERATRAKLIDWDDSAANEFTAVNQLTIVEGGHNRRPDVLLYVNGLPLGQLELKNPSLDEDGPAKAVNQVNHYRLTIPGLYRYVEVIGVSDLLRARVGTITTPVEHFAEWKTMDPEGMKGRSQLEILIRGVFAPSGLLDLIRNFVLFETSGAKTWKVMAKYHQVDAVNRAVEATAEAMADKTRRAGVVWHTQGAGKSYSMVFYVTKLRRDTRFANPTVVCVTDTNDLDNQLSETFARQAHLARTVDQADRIQGGERGLYELLAVPADGIVFTTMQKFGRREEQGPIPVLSTRENVVVIADEAHRSQYEDLARNLINALPNATRIGFTGTPIETADRSTRNAFGDYISVYRMAQAQEDGATVPIYYESRQVPVAAEREAIEQLQARIDQESDEVQTELSTEFARMDAIVGAPERLDRVVDDLATHFTDRCRTLPGKAMVVAYSRRIAAEYAVRLRARLGDDAVDAVINASATDPQPISDFRKTKQQLKAIEARYKDPDSQLRVIVVKNMWLTGFDAPVMHTLYVDKPMRDHGLLQAIARVNRVFEGKPGGLVVDYIGIGDDLRSGLKAYAQSDVDDAVVSLDVARRHLVEKHEVMCDLLHGIAFRPPGDARPAVRATVLAAAAQEAVARFVLDEERTQLYLDEQQQYARWFALVSPNEPSVAQRYDHDFFATIAAALRAAAAELEQLDGSRPSRETRQAVEQFFSEGLAGGEIVDVFELAGEERPEISVLSDEFLDDIGGRLERPELEIALLRKLLSGQIRARLSANRTQHKRFSEELAAVLARYNEQQMTSAAVIKELVALAKRLREQSLRNEQLGLSREETAFYDALANNGERWVDDPRLKDLAVEIVEQVRKDLAVDWTERSNLEAQVRSRIKRLLRRHKSIVPQTNGGIDDVADRVFEQARALYRRYPEVEGDWP
ncbi:MAG TPA: type I restriction endonuclease subunit R [Conexibacter sp.]|jgi:type I restriction enzyme R subunit|nr:type I restriction endonuclease subunit R [Conexibacter sp.]